MSRKVVLLALGVVAIVGALVSVFAAHKDELASREAPNVYSYSFSRRATATTSPYQADNSTFDYIVVGAGPGGGVSASHLASIGFRVLLLEAGGDPVRVTCVLFL